ncbi:MAG TPA: tetratricopeptide repeat protein [Longimicrobiales bacterium]|nr:tetratricopeptide repeat protein [Longimicrobiales bacterium]
MPDAREFFELALGYEASGSHDRALSFFARSRDATSDAVIQAQSWRHEADIYRTRCDWDHALGAARRSADVAQAAGLIDEFAEAVNAEAAVYHTRGDFARASALYRRILDLNVDDRVRGIAYQNVGLVSLQSGQPREAEHFFHKSIDCFRRAGYARGETIALINHGRSRLEQGDAEAAQPIFREAEQRALKLGDLELLAMARINYAEALLESGGSDRAFDLICTALGHFDSTGNDYRRVECLRMLGDIHRRGGQVDEARGCYEHACQIAKKIDARAELDVLRQRLELIAPAEPAS